jgi:NitT/TauT family transport system substrate-binding protein
MQSIQTRRRFLANLTTAGIAGSIGIRGASARDVPLETNTVRFSRGPGICIAPSM